MYDQNTQNTQNINPLLAIFLIAQFIFIALLAFTIPRLFESNDITVNQDRLPSATIDDLNEYLPNLGNDAQKDIENSLHDLILANSPDQTVKNSKTNATLKEVSSLHFDRLGGINYLSAVIDVPEVNQSYDFYYAYSDDPENGEFQGFFNILCPDRPEAKIYPDFNCQDTNTDSWLQYPATHLGLASSFLPYYYFDHFSISINSSEPTKVTITPISFDIDEATRSSYIEETKSAVQALGFSPDLFTYYVSTVEDIDYTNE